MSDNDTYTIVLTGASGYLGQHCLQGFVENTALLSPRRVVIHAVQQRTDTAPLTSALASAPSVVRVHAVDLTSADACRAWLNQLSTSTSTRLDCCIHAAAVSSPGVCDAEPERAAAVNVPTHFWEALWQHHPQICIVALSTDQVYQGDVTPGSLYTEESTAQPVNVYGRTKVALEEYLMQRRNEQYPDSTVLLLRSSIMLGPLAPYIPAHDTFLHFIQARATSTDTEPTTYFTNEIRSVIAVSDVVTILLRLVKIAAAGSAHDALDSGMYCMGGPGAVSRYDMAMAVLDYLQLSSHRATSAVKENTAGSVQSPLNIGMDSSKLYRLVGLSAPQTLADIVASTFSKPTM